MKRHHLVALTSACVVTTWAGWKIGIRAGTATPPPPDTAAPFGTTGPTDDTVDPELATPAPDFRGARTAAAILEQAAAERIRSDLENRGDLLATLWQLRPDEIPDFLARLGEWPPPVPGALYSAVLGRLAESAPIEAMGRADRLPGPSRDEARVAVISSWAKRDPAAAWQWYREAWAAAPEPRYPLERCFLPLIHAWAMKDAKAALDACLSEDQHGTLDPWAGLGSLAALPERRDEMLRLLSGVADEGKRAAALCSALGVWSSSEPRAAAAWLDAQPQAASHDLVWAVAERFGVMDHAAASEWLWNRSPPESREQEIVTMALPQWAHSDPEAAEAWLRTKPHGDPARQTMAGAWASVDMDRALQWAGEITPASRADTVVSVFADAKSLGKSPDLSRCAAVAGLSEDEFAKRVAAAPRWR